MAYYDQLIAKWATLAGTKAQKLTALNALTVPAPALPCIIPPSQILNAIAPADIMTLSSVDLQRLTLLLAGSSIDASAGTTIRTGLQSLFAGKTQTLQNLLALAAPFDNPTQPWWKSVGYPSPIADGDLDACGLT